MIPRSTALGEASFYGKPAVLYEARSQGADAYRTLARELLSRRAEIPLHAGILERFGTEG
jgi:chromosome partitioning protein